MEGTEWLLAVDALRGLALLGILARNIDDPAWPDSACADTHAGGRFDGTDQAALEGNAIWVESVRKHVAPTPEEKGREWDRSLAIHRGG